MSCIIPIKVLSKYYRNNWQQQDSKPQSLSLEMNTQPFS